MDQNRNILNSWKEISQYLGRGVRTVQRWERDFALPVRRPAGHVKSSVIALRSDIDQWLASRSARMEDAVISAAGYATVVQNIDDHARLNSELEVIKARYRSLLESNKRLKGKLARAVALANRLRTELKQPPTQQLPPPPATIPDVGSPTA
jgi:predicted DNA-binding transcriptional regulator AlpA